MRWTDERKDVNRQNGRNSEAGHVDKYNKIPSIQAGQRHKGLDLLPKMGGGEKNLGIDCC